jgi:hypothetical protein
MNNKQTNSQRFPNISWVRLRSDEGIRAAAVGSPALALEHAASYGRT